MTFKPEYGSRVMNARLALKHAVLENVLDNLGGSSGLHWPDESWEKITKTAQELIDSQVEWKEYMDAKHKANWGK